MIEQRIKNLAIALEALSRINAAEDLFISVHRLLDQVIEEAKERPPQPKRTPPILDDEIPF